MLIEKEVKKILSQLMDNCTKNGNLIRVALGGLDIIIRFLDNGSKIALSTLVYEGDNYMPYSVRHALARKPPFSHAYIPAYLTLNEQQFQVVLNYLGHAELLTNGSLKELLEEFGMLAEKWRLHLNERDRNDLVYARVK